VRAEDFKDEHLIAYSVPREQLTVYQEVLAPSGIMPRALSHVELTEAIVEMVKAGIGIGVLARWAVAPQLETGALTAIPLTRRGFHRQWSAATLRSRSTMPYLKKFVSLLREAPLVQPPQGGDPPKASRAQAL
jgi:LysR family transcriptional regulator for metE and metH